MGLALLIVIGTFAALFVFGIRIITEYDGWGDSSASRQPVSSGSSRASTAW